MSSRTLNKKKIINDPVYGFIKIPSELIYDIIESKPFQRLRHIKQLGLTYYVYPGAVHTRFQHALGAMHLMVNAIQVIREKGHEITEAEAEAVTIAILLHDVGHGPFSHTLEHSFVQSITHEDITLLFMKQLNAQFNNQLDMAIRIFEGSYHKAYLHSLVSGQLDMDRTDYLRRDSFFTGVVEGAVGSERLINMLNVANGELVIDLKGIYSVEKFLIARRLMYWQVYLHKTVVASEEMLIQILQRAKDISAKGADMFAAPHLKFFLQNSIKSTKDMLEKKDKYGNSALELFELLDDNDVLSAIKAWIKSADKVLAKLCSDLIYRNFPVLEIRSCEYSDIEVEAFRKKAVDELGIAPEDTHYFVYSNSVSNSAYSSRDYNIKVLGTRGKVVDIIDASDISNISALSKKVTKYCLIYPKELRVAGK